MPTNITSPVGRLVGGSLYKPQLKTDNQGQPKLGRDGQQIKDFWIALAIPKGQEQNWSQTVWGQQILAEGNKAHPGICQAVTYAWKITDGDSQIPNKKGKKPCDQDGYPGNWVLNLSGGFAPRIYNRDGTQVLTEVDAVKPGYYVQINFDVQSNNSAESPGLYLNHRMVAFSAYGEEISYGPDPSAAGFGQAPLPAGASATPTAAFTPAAPTPTPAVAAPVPIAVTPNHAFVAGPGAPPAAPAPAPMPPAAPIRTMLPPANGHSYDSLIKAGWTDQLLVQHGYMAP